MTALGGIGDLAAHTGRHHYFMDYRRRFGAGGVDLALAERVTDLGGDGDIPERIRVDAVSRATPCDE